MEITEKLLKETLDGYLDGKTSFYVFRELVYSFYTNEGSVKINRKITEMLISILAVYLEHDEVITDKFRDVRLKRLQKILEAKKITAEHAFFAIHFCEIYGLLEKFTNGKINRRVFEEQIKKITPILLDWKRIFFWAYAHQDNTDIDISKMP